jgi:hypothetical protein
MGEETHDDTTRCSTQTAVGAGDIATLRGADNYFSAGRGSDSVGAVAWEDDNDRAAIHVSEFVGFCEGVGGQIDAEPVPVREPDGGRVADRLRGVADDGLMGVRPASAPRLCPHQLGEHLRVDVITLAR